MIMRAHAMKDFCTIRFPSTAKYNTLVYEGIKEIISYYINHCNPEYLCAAILRLFAGVLNYIAYVINSNNHILFL